VIFLFFAGLFVFALLAAVVAVLAVYAFLLAAVVVALYALANLAIALTVGLTRGRRTSSHRSKYQRKVTQ
jgi:hypothetical protein